MGYESAPATQMLATQCAVCSRPLLDAKSVELGIGPECRRRWGFNCKDVDEAARKQANQIVYQIAVQQDGLDVGHACERLRDLGFVVLADKILDRVAPVWISEDQTDGRLTVSAPYHEGAVAAWRDIPGRIWDRESKLNIVPATQRRALWQLLQRYYGGQVGRGPKGVFVIPDVIREAA